MATQTALYLSDIHPAIYNRCQYFCDLTKLNFMQKITPCLWFDGKVEEAVKFYTSVFKDSKAKKMSYYGEAGPGKKGTAMTATFQLNGQDFMILNGGPMFKFNESISFVIDCKTQKEVDYYWDKLSAGGYKDRCGWVKDKYGVSWQIVPGILGELLADKDPAKTKKVMQAMLQMDKLDIKALKKAYAGK